MPGSGGAAQGHSGIRGCPAHGHLMPRHPRVKGRELIKALAKIGFLVVRIRGSHHFLKHTDGRATVVPVHAGETLGPGLMTKILSDVDISVDQLNKLL